MVAHRTNIKPDQRLIDMIGWILRTPSRALFVHTDFRDDLNLDAVDLILLIAQLESHFGVFLDPEEVSSIKTIGDAVNYFGASARA